jgi:hypothetical protein
MRSTPLGLPRCRLPADQLAPSCRDGKRREGFHPCRSQATTYHSRSTFHIPITALLPCCHPTSRQLNPYPIPTRHPCLPPLPLNRSRPLTRVRVSYQLSNFLTTRQVNSSQLKLNLDSSSSFFSQRSPLPTAPSPSSRRRSTLEEKLLPTSTTRPTRSTISSLTSPRFPGLPSRSGTSRTEDSPRPR